MSVRCITQVLDRSVHAGTHLLMLIVLADYSDDEGNSYPAVASLARKCRMKPRNANYILKALQVSGELRVLKNEGPRGTNRYRIMLASLGLNKPLQPIAPRQKAAPLQDTAPAPAIQCRFPLQSVADEPSLNRQEPSLKKNADALFSSFWSAYPKKTAKPAAAKAFKSAKINSLQMPSILQDIDRRKSDQDWQKENGKFVPNPATYLNQRRWEDEVAIHSKAEPKPWEGAR